MSSGTQTNSVVGPSTTPAAIMNGTSSKQETSSSLSSQASASGAFSKLIDAVKECSKYESAYNDIEVTQNLLVQRESELKRTRKELQHEKNNHTHLITRQVEELKNRDTEKKILETTNGELNKTLEDERKRMDGALKEERKKTEMIRRENEDLKSKLEKQKENIASLEREWKDEKANSLRLEMELARTKSAKSDVDSELAACREELREWNSYGAVLHVVDVGDFSNKMHNLWTRFQKFADKYFLVNLPESLFAEPTQWDSLVEPLQIVEGIPPLPPGNSVAAKQMRMAAALAIVADRIGYHIFAPIYTGTRDDGIRELLLQHADTDFNREAACRALVLSGYAEDHQKRAAEELVSEVTKKVSSLVGCFLSPSVTDSFRAELKTLIHDEMTLWWFAQRSSHKIETSVEDDERWEWNSLNVFDTAASKPEPDQFQIALFPRVIIARDDEWGLVFPGAALWESQTAAADQEWQKHKAVVKTARRTMSFRGPGSSGRRTSRIDGYGNGPGSPTNTSFLDRRKSWADRGDG